MLINDVCKFVEEKKGCIHIGAHEGEERFWYEQNKFKKVIWFEPQQKAFGILSRNIKDFPNHSAFKKGVDEKLEHGILHIANNGQSSSLLQLGTHATNHPEVKYIDDYQIELTRLDSFIDNHNINITDFNFLNIDVQGNELSVIKSIGRYIQNIDYIYTEINTEQVYVGCCTVEEIDYHLGRFGFVRLITKMTKAGWGDAFYKKY